MVSDSTSWRWYAPGPPLLFTCLQIDRDPRTRGSEGAADAARHGRRSKTDSGRAEKAGRPCSPTTTSGTPTTSTVSTRRWPSRAPHVESRSHPARSPTWAASSSRRRGQAGHTFVPLAMGPMGMASAFSAGHPGAFMFASPSVGAGSPDNSAARGRPLHARRMPRPPRSRYPRTDAA
jgi:hypothetical protein